ncbi:ribokinase [Streptomyces sp. SID2999]|uniref:ribokinase n=1 Tax=Streptomyces sp. SID2999 TaxID=2690258 RepID=UPI0013685E1B|nr:ribokinase [Streptomyces sp. SID2999]MYZ11290.1 ribokinase [Streptomyces sp. SID2999]
MTHIVVLGSTNMDLVTYVARAPQRGETVTGREFRTIPGGKGANQAMAAARAGATVSLIGAVGNDAYGVRLRDNLEHSGVDTDFLRTVEGPSGTAHIVVDDQGNNAIVVVPGANGTVDHLSPGDEGLIASADALLLQLEVPLPAVIAGAEAARRHGVRTVLTPSPAQPLPEELLSVTDVLVPNEYEAVTLTGRTDPLDAAVGLLDLVPEVVLTLGEAGVLYVSRDTEPLAVPAHQVAAIDSTGAGDTFAGAYAVAVAEEKPLREALSWAAAAAALSVQREGASASMPYRPEIEAQYTA